MASSIDRALHVAVAALYFDDRADFFAALWQVVRILDPDMARMLEDDEQAAYKASRARIEKEEP